MTFHIGRLPLASNLILSPLAGYTNLPMRLVLRELGGVGLCVTDLVNARSLIEKNPKALKLIESAPADRPLSVQLFGSIASEMVEAARMVEAHGADMIDINMGCPVRKVCKVGGGSAMMTEIDRTASLVAQMIAAVRIPVTAKMRLGWDEQNLTAPHLALALQEVGVSAIMVHGRTREQGFEGSVNLAGIRAVVESVRQIPVIGNGDVTTPSAAVRMMQETGCAGVGIGRGAFYNPWIFSQINHFVRTRELLPEPNFESRIQVLTRHLELMIEVFGEPHGCRLFRKVAPWYAKRFGPASFFNRRIVLLSSRQEYFQILEEYRQWRATFLDADGELQPRYRPGAMEDNFVDTPMGISPAVAARVAIPVPRGPQELW